MGGFRSFSINVGCLVAIAMAEAMAAGAITCADVESCWSPCLGYLRGGGAVPPPSCCNGVKSVYAAAPTKADREAVCGCLKTIVPRLGGVRVDYVNDVIRNCQIPVSFRYYPKKDCSKVL